jgi:hypothetical protein
MCSERQAAANRLNAQKSTGPRTPEGKNKASQNAVTHGLTSHRPVLDNEDTAEFRKYVNELIDQLDPTNPWEFVFAKRASCQAWRIQRALCYETLALDNLLQSAKDNDKTNPISQLSAQKSTSKNTKTKNKPNNVGQASVLDSKSAPTPQESSSINESLDSQIENLSPRDRKSSIENHKSLLGQAIVDDFRNHWTLDKLARYESRIENSMIRCLDKFKKVRESQMMNFTSLRHYYRGFTRRPQDFQDDLNTQTPNVGEASVLHSKSPSTPESSSPNVDEASVLHNETNKTNPISQFSAQKTASENEITKNEPNSQAPTGTDAAAAASALVASTCPDQRGKRSEDASLTVDLEDGQDPSQQPEESQTPSHSSQDFNHIENRQSNIENPNAALVNNDFDSFSQWAKLKGHAYGYDDESLEPHCPNPPAEGEYVYVENWHHELLRMVNYPWDKRKNLTKPQLNDLVDTILCGMPDPIQFLWDFGLIELTAEAVAKRHRAAQAQEQVPALAC